MSRSVWIVALLFSSIETADVLAQTEVADSSWFPAKEGTIWTYRVEGHRVTVRAAKPEKQGKVLCARFETVDKNEIVAVQHLAVVSSGVSRVAHNGEKIEPPLILLKLPPSASQWEVDSKLSNRSGVDVYQGKATEDLVDFAVPGMPSIAGKFIRVSIEMKINGQPISVTSWYAEKVGLFKQRLIVGERVQDMVLEKVEFPK